MSEPTYEYKWPVTETDVARPVVRWLQDMRWEVYQEVGVLGRVADIVAVQGPVYWIIEVKRTASLALLEQAMDWKSYAHRISVAFPYTARRWQKLPKGRVAFTEACTTFGIGIFKVSAPNSAKENGEWVHGVYISPLQVSEECAGRLDRRPASLRFLTDILCEEQKTWCEAGAQSGKRVTPFLLTCEALRGFVEDNPGTSLKGAVDAITHHYSTPASARQSLASWIREGVVDGVEFREVDGSTGLYLTRAHTGGVR